MKNFPIKHEDKTYWISRSCATATFVFGVSPLNELYILANKRGLGTPDFQGMWSCPCGYVDYGETIEYCAVREVKEETGVRLDIRNLALIEINSVPIGKQNITVIYLYLDKLSKLNKNLTNKYSEVDEVDEIKFINLRELDDYKWAFDHKTLIKKYAKDIMKRL